MRKSALRKTPFAIRTQQWMTEFGLQGTLVEKLEEASQPFGNSVMTYSFPPLLLQFVLDRGYESLEFAHEGERHHFMNAWILQVLFGEKSLDEVLAGNIEHGIAQHLKIFSRHWPALVQAFSAENAGNTVQALDQIERQYMRRFSSPAKTPAS